jgi:hypothetical protein
MDGENIYTTTLVEEGIIVMGNEGKQFLQVEALITFVLQSKIW